MTDNERAVIEAAVEWGCMRDLFGDNPEFMELPISGLAYALDELHNESDGKWEPSDD